MKSKCIDLKYFLMKHFESEFNSEEEVPRQWNTMKEDDIRKIHVRLSLFRAS